MKPMRLYTAFHANLDFSALPDADRPLVLARCYWPLLALPEELGIPIGFEMSARTLRALQSEDPEWVKKFRGLAERGLVEPIASGYAQIVGPLVPTEVNRSNLIRGNALYQELLGFVPETFFVAEQTYADGLAPLFAEAGARRLIMEWNNPAAFQTALRPLRCQPARLRSSEGRGPILLWNDSIVFQKMQRVAHGQIPTSELDVLLDRLVSAESAEALCIYGGDVEIFDYRPSRAVSRADDAAMGVEMSRLTEAFRMLASDPRFEFVLPREVACAEDILPEVELGSPADPIPCKKQPRYNPTRWVVSGRDGFSMNTRCHRLLKTERAARGIAPKFEGHRLSEAMLDLWRSDFRTRATEEKVLEFGGCAELGMQRAQANLESAMPALGEGEDLLLVNPGESDWSGLPVEVPLRLPVGRYFDVHLRTRRGAEVAPADYQLEISGRHRDGSIREANLVLEPQICAGGPLGLSLDPVGAGEAATPAQARTIEETEQVSATFLLHRGAALEAVRFPDVDAAALFGTIPHGHFDEIAWTPDFYSGHVVAVSENGTKETDLRPTVLDSDPNASGPVRITLRAQVMTAYGPWRKSYRLYRRQPRIDLIHDLSFHDARVASLRLGALTLLPNAWERSQLRYGTVNGGTMPEWRALEPGARLCQSSAVSSTVTASSCLGATQGWVAIEDETRGIMIQGDRAEAALAPMLDFQAVDEQFFCRLTQSAAESDETRATFLRGRKRFGLSVEAYRADDGERSGVLERAVQRDHGLVYRTAAGVGLSGGL